MSLSQYKQKRKFDKTPEPQGGASAKTELRFVVQKHDASHLHYDFRLEIRGILKSWAVPKGPSMDTSIKRLAMMVEDHPYDYRDFEGIIPEGNYGAGTVIVWDEGTYTPMDSTATDVKAMEKELMHQVHSGKIKITLKGKKLKGDFALVKAHGRGENGWLLMKLEDRYASTNDILLKDKSVISKKTLDKVAATTTTIYGRKTIDPKKKAAPKKKAVKDEFEDTDIGLLLKKGKRSAFPNFFKPMLATLTEQAFDNEHWLYEIKWDGYRALSFVNKNMAKLYSRNELSFNDKFGAIAEALQGLELNAVMDGEIIAINKDGSANFQQLQGFVKNNKQAELVYFVFDLLWYDSKDLSQLPLLERKAILQSIIPANNKTIKYSGHVMEAGIDFYKAALAKGLEGIMAKKADSEYIKGKRSAEWLKIKNSKTTEAIICGYTKPRNSRKHFGAVILGKYTNEELTYIGHTGSGFDDNMLGDLIKKFKRLERKTCPFSPKPKTNNPATWLRPELVCEVKYAEWTSDGHLRQPIFLGIREDKKGKDEKQIAIVPPPKNSTEIEDSSVTTAEKKRSTTAHLTKKVKGKKRKVILKPLLDKQAKEEHKKVNTHLLKLTNLDKIYWPKENISKRDLLNYYHAVAPFILPYLKDRPQSLNRHPNGITNPNFYQKDVTDKVPEWIKTHPYTSDSNGDEKAFLVCTNEASLLYMASLGCIEMNPWHSRIQTPEKPDWCLIDLDPDTNKFEQVIETALVLKQILDDLGVSSYCKTSGSTGMHIFIPLQAKYDFDQSKMFAELLVNMVYKELPKFTSVERSPAKRKGKIYLDFLQNRKIQTVAAPYSLRPKPGATVSMPLHWDEVRMGLKMNDFTIHNTLDRLKEKGDIFHPVLGKGIDLKNILSNLSEE